LEIAGIAERNSEHPLAQAVLTAADENHIPITERSYFEYVPGKGVRAGLHQTMAAPARPKGTFANS
jgi:cation transport ATPase